MSLYRGPSIIGESANNNVALVLSAISSATNAANAAAAASSSEVNAQSSEEAAAASALQLALYEGLLGTDSATAEASRLAAEAAAVVATDKAAQTGEDRTAARDSAINALMSENGAGGKAAEASGHANVASGQAYLATNAAATTQTLRDSIIATQGAIGYLPPVAYAAGLAITLPAQTVSYAGQAYAPILSALPFTTSGTFEAAKFRLIQGVAAVDLVAATGSGLLGHDATAVYALGTLGAMLNDIAVNVKMFPWRAKGDGVTNDTDAFAAASAFIQAKGGGRLIVPAGVYIVGKQTFANGAGKGYAYLPSKIIEIKNCTKPVVLEFQGAVLKMAPGLKFGSFDPVTGAVYNPAMPFTNAHYKAQLGVMILLQSNANVSIVGAVELDGNQANMTLGGTWGDTGRQLTGYGFQSYSNGITNFENIYAHHHCCDGGAIGYAGLTDLSSPKPVRLSNIICDYNARQGLSIIGAKGLTAINCHFTNTGKGTFATSPGAGLDIEAESAVIRDLVFINCSAVNNTGAGVVADSGDSANISFNSCTMIGTTNWALWPKKPRMVFRDCLIVGGIVSPYTDAANPDNAAKFYNCKITDEVSLSPTGTVYSGGYLLDFAAAWNVLLDGCTVVATTKPLLYAINGFIIRNSTFIIRTNTTYLGDQQPVVIITGGTIDGLTVVDDITTNIPTNCYRINLSNNIVSGSNFINSPNKKIMWLAPNTPGAYLGQSSGKAFAMPNLALGKCYGIDQLPYYGSLNIVAWTAIPPSGNWEKADRCINSNPSVGAAKGWICTSSGTAGTLNAGNTTGGITTGTPTLVVSSASGITVGSYLAIAGAVTSSAVKTIVGTTITLTNNATATVAGAVVSFVEPTWVSEGNL